VQANGRFETAMANPVAMEEVAIREEVAGPATGQADADAKPGAPDALTVAAELQTLRMLQGLTVAMMIIVLGCILLVAVGIQYNDETTKKQMIGLMLTVAAWLSTAIGGSLVMIPRVVSVTDPKNASPESVSENQVLRTGLGFAAGVMLAITLGEILSKSTEGLLEAGLDERAAQLAAIAYTALGLVCMAVLDAFTHWLAHKTNTAEESAAAITNDQVTLVSAETANRLKMMSCIAMLAIMIHNGPEGVITYTSVLGDLRVGMLMAVGIIVHNLPEGLLVSLPRFYAMAGMNMKPSSGGLYPYERFRAMLFSWLSGLSEPICGFIAYLVMGQDDALSGDFLGALFGLVGGFMIYVVVYELFPAAFAKPTEKKKGLSASSVSHAFIAGCAVMLLSIAFMTQPEE
jgi:ZIP family zinc transporter